MHVRHNPSSPFRVQRSVNLGLRSLNPCASLIPPARPGYPAGTFTCLPHVQSIEVLACQLSFPATCYNLVFPAAASDSNTPRHEFWSFSTNRLAACSKDTTRSVFGAPSYVGGQIRRSS